MRQYICQMQTSPLRFILALAVGVFVAYAVIIFFQSYIPKLLSYEPLADDADVFQFEKYLAALSPQAIAALIACAAIGAFSGGYTAARIEKNKKETAALGVGIFSTVIAVFMIIAFTYPLALALGICAALIPFAYLGGRVASYR